MLTCRNQAPQRLSPDHPWPSRCLVPWEQEGLHTGAGSCSTRERHTATVPWVGAGPSELQLLASYVILFSIVLSLLKMCIYITV